MSVLGRLKSLLGFGEENQNDISSFQDAGTTPDGTTGTESVDSPSFYDNPENRIPGVNAPQPRTQSVDVISQNQTLPEDVVKPNQTTGTQTTGTQTTGNETGTQTGTQTIGTQTRGTGTPPPPGATPGIVGSGGINFGAGSEFVRVMPGQVVETTDKKGVKSKSIEDLIEIGGSGFDDDVYARKLRRQAAMPDLKNEDYYPNEPFTESRTAWGDPIYSGAGALFPMAAYDAQRKARAQAELDEAKRDIMQLKIPEIKTGAYVQRFRGDYTNEILGAVDEAVKQAGGNRQRAMRNLKQSGKLAEIENKYNGIAKSIDQTADRIKNFLQKAQESPDDYYSSAQGITAGINFMNGTGAYADGLISGEDLNKLEQMAVTAVDWDNYKKEALEKFSDDEVVPGLMGDKLTPEEDNAYQKQLNLTGGLKDKRHFLIVKKYSEANKDKIKQAIVIPFFNRKRTAMEQWMKKENETVDQTIDRIADEIVAARGTKIFEDVISESESGDTNINLNSKTTTNKPYYERINQQRDSIISGTKDALDKINKANQQGQQRVGALQGAVKNIFRGISDQGEITKEYIGFEPVNVKPYNFKLQPSLLGEYMVYDEKTKSFRNSTPADFGIDATQFSTRAAGGSLVGQEIVLMTPNGKLVPWDSKDVPAGSELFVKQKINIEYEPKTADAQYNTIPAKSKTVYSIGPITQNFKVADDVLQAKTLQESTQSAGQPFTFGEPK
jgi:hypothetical protein